MIWLADDGTRHESPVVFHKTKEAFGELSNMAGGFALRIGEARIPTSEALYQACRFPHQPDWQRDILAPNSPMAAKMASRKEGRRDSTRPDWDDIVVDVMRWCLRVKLAQHFAEFGRVLRSTGARPIVERSHRDRFWGAVADEDEVLAGRNLLGQLLMELRADLLARPEEMRRVEPLAVPDFLLLSQPIGVVVG